MRQNDTENAIKYFSNTILIKNAYLSNSMLAIIYKNIGQYDESIEVLDKFEKDTFPPIIASDTNAVRRFVNISMYPIITADNSKENNSQILYNKAKAYYEKEDYDKALNLLTQYETLADVEPFSMYLTIYLAKNDMKNADKYFKLINEKSNASLDLEDELASGLYYIMTKDYANAEKLFSEMSTPKNINNNSKTPRMKYGYYGLGLMYKEKKDYDKAFDNFKKALEISPYWYKAKKEMQVCRCE